MHKNSYKHAYLTHDFICENNQKQNYLKTERQSSLGKHTQHVNKDEKQKQYLQTQFTKILRNSDKYKQNLPKFNSQFLMTQKLDKYKAVSQRKQSNNFLLKQYQLQKENKQFQLNFVKGINNDYENQLIKLKNKLEKQKFDNLQLKQQAQKLRAEIYQLRDIQIEYEESRIVIRKLQQQIDEKNRVILQINAENQNICFKIEQYKQQILDSREKVQRSGHKQQLLEEKYSDIKSLLTQRQEKWRIQKLNLQHAHKILKTQNEQKFKLISKVDNQNQKLISQFKQLEIQNTELRQKVNKLQSKCSIIQQQKHILSQQMKSEQYIWKQQTKKVQQRELYLRQVLKQKQNKIISLEYEIQNLTKQLKQCKCQCQILIQKQDIVTRQINLLDKKFYKIQLERIQTQNSFSFEIEKWQQKQISWNLQKQQFQLQYNHSLLEQKRMFELSLISLEQNLRQQSKLMELQSAQNQHNLIIQLRQAINSSNFEVQSLKIKEKQLMQVNQALKNQNQKYREELIILKQNLSLIREQNVSYEEKKAFLEKQNTKIIKDTDNSGKQMKRVEKDINVPKKWFEQKIQYQYKISSLCNEVEKLIEEISFLKEDKNIEQQNVQFLKNKSIQSQKVKIQQGLNKQIQTQLDLQYLRQLQSKNDENEIIKVKQQKKLQQLRQANRSQQQIIKRQINQLSVQCSQLKKQVQKQKELNEQLTMQLVLKSQEVQGRIDKKVK